MKNSLMRIGKWLTPGALMVASISMVLGAVGCDNKVVDSGGATPTGPTSTYVTPGTGATTGGGSGTNPTPGAYVTPGTSGASGTAPSHAGPTPGAYVTPGTR